MLIGESVAAAAVGGRRGRLRKLRVQPAAPEHLEDLLVVTVGKPPRGRASPEALDQRGQQLPKDKVRYVV